MRFEKYIVLVEDNPDDVALTLRAFDRGEYVCSVRVFTNGIEALEYLQGHGRYAGRDTRDAPCVILLDIQLPQLDGLKVLERLRAHEATRLIPVVMLTTSAERADLLKSYALGANSYICKPVDFSQFVELIQTVGRYWLAVNRPVHEL